MKVYKTSDVELKLESFNPPLIEWKRNFLKKTTRKKDQNLVILFVQDVFIQRRSWDFQSLIIILLAVNETSCEILFVDKVQTKMHLHDFALF